MTDKIRRPSEVTDLAEPVNPSRSSTKHKSEDADNVDIKADRTVGVVEEKAERVVDDQAGSKAGEQVVKAKSKTSPWLVVLCASALFFLSWTLYDFSKLVIEIYSSQLILASVLALLGLLFLASLVWLLVHEYKAWKSFDALSHRQAVIKQAVKNNDLPLLKQALLETLKNIKSVNPDLVSQFEDAAFINNTPEEYLRQLENIVLLPLDKQVDVIIKKSAIAAGLSVFIIPHPALDAIAVTWHGLLLSKKIAIMYGIKPSGLSSLRLFRHILSSAVLAAGAEVASEVIADSLAENATEGAGEVLFGSLFSKVGEGAVTVWRIYRLGRIVRLIIRPRG